MKYLWLLFFLIQFSLVVCFAQNMPETDDFDTVLHFLLQYQGAEGLLQKLKLIFLKHNEHLMVLNRLATIYYFKFFGTLNFKYLVILGSSVTISYYILLKKLLPAKKYYHYFPLALILYQPSYAHATLWATASLQYLWFYAAALVVFCLAFREKFFLRLLSVIFALLAICLQAGGIFIPVIISFVHFIKKDLKSSLIWFFILIVLYQITSSASLSGSTVSLSFFYKSFLSVLGSAIGYKNYLLSIVSGVVFFGFGLYLLSRGLHKSRPELFAFLLFLLISFSAIALFRQEMGLWHSYSTGRYTLISVLYLCGVYLACLEVFLEKRVFHFGCVFASAFFCFSYFSHFHEYLDQELYLRDSNVRWQLNHTGLAYPVAIRAETILKQSINAGNYQPTLLDLQKFSLAEISAPQIGGKNEELKFSIEHSYLGKDFLELTGWAFFLNKDSSQTKLYLKLKNGEHQYFFELARRNRFDVDLVHNKNAPTGMYLKSGYFALVNANILSKGSYEISVIAVANDIFAVNTLRDKFVKT